MFRLAFQAGLGILLFRILVAFPVLLNVSGVEVGFVCTSGKAMLLGFGMVVLRSVVILRCLLGVTVFMFCRFCGLVCKGWAFLDTESGFDSFCASVVLGLLIMCVDCGFGGLFGGFGVELFSVFTRGEPLDCMFGCHNDGDLVGVGLRTYTGFSCECRGYIGSWSC